MNEILEKIKNLFKPKQDTQQQKTGLFQFQEPKDLVKNFSLPKIELPKLNLNEPIIKLPTQQNKKTETQVSQYIKNLTPQSKPQSPQQTRSLIFKEKEDETDLGKSLGKLGSAMTDTSKTISQYTQQVAQPALGKAVDVLLNLTSKGVGTLISGKAPETIKELGKVKTTEDVFKIYEKAPTAYEATRELTEKLGAPKYVSIPAGIIAEILTPIGFFGGLGKTSKYSQLIDDIAKTTDREKIYEKLLNELGSSFKEDILKTDEFRKLADDLVKITDKVEVDKTIKNFVKKNEKFLVNEAKALTKEIDVKKVKDVDVLKEPKIDLRKTGKIDFEKLIETKPDVKKIYDITPPIKGFDDFTQDVLKSTRKIEDLKTKSVDDVLKLIENKKSIVGEEGLKKEFGEKINKEIVKLETEKNKAINLIDKKINDVRVEFISKVEEILNKGIKDRSVKNKIINAVRDVALRGDNVLDLRKIIDEAVESRKILGKVFKEKIEIDEKLINKINKIKDNTLKKIEKLNLEKSFQIERLNEKISNLRNDFDEILKGQGLKNVKVLENIKDIVLKKDAKISGLKTQLKEVEKGLSEKLSLKEKELKEITSSKIDKLIAKRMDELSYLEEKIKKVSQKIGERVSKENARLLEEYKELREKRLKQLDLLNKLKKLIPYSQKEINIIFGKRKFSDANKLRINAIRKLLKNIVVAVGNGKTTFGEVYEILRKGFLVDDFTKLNRREALIFNKIVLRDLAIGKKVDIERLKRIVFESEIPNITAMAYFRKYKKTFIKLGDVVYDEVYKPLRDAFKKYSINLTDEKMKFEKMLKDLNLYENKEASRKIFEYLDGKKVELSINEKKVAEYIREKLDYYIDKINEIRKRLGYKEIEKRENYITHIILEGFRNELLVKSKNLGDDIIETNKLLFYDILPIKEIKNPTLLERKNVLIPLKKDAFKVFETYLTLANKSIYFDDVLHRINNFITYAKASDETKRFIWNFVKKSIGYSSRTVDFIFDNINSFIVDALKKFDETFKTNIFSRKITEKDYAIDLNDIKDLSELREKLIGFDERIAKDFVLKIFPLRKGFTALVSRLKLMNYMSFIGLNLKTMYYNLITQPLIFAPSHLKGNPIINAIGIGKEMLKAAVKFFSEAEKNKYLKLGVINNLEYLYDTGFQKTGKLAELTLLNMKVSEFINRVAVYEYSKKSFNKTLLKNNISKEIIETQLEDMARAFTEMINFRYDIFEKIPFFDTAAGLFYSQYNTFAVNQISIIFDDLKRIGNKKALKEFIEAVNQGKGADYLTKYGAPERLALLKSFFMTSIIFSMTLSLSGINPLDFFKDELKGEKFEKVKDTFNYLFKGFIPSQVDYLLDMIIALINGDDYSMAISLRKLVNPPVISGLEKSRTYEETLTKLKNEGIISYDLYRKAKSVYVPKNVVPAEIQIYRVLKGETLPEKIGISKIVSSKSKYSLPVNKKEDRDLFDIENKITDDTISIEDKIIDILDNLDFNSLDLNNLDLNK